jgi:hypothetical protein
MLIAINNNRPVIFNGEINIMGDLKRRNSLKNPIQYILESI